MKPNFTATDKAPAAETQAEFADGTTGRANSKVNGVAGGNSHDPAHGGSPAVAEGLNAKDRGQAAQEKEGIQDAPEGDGDGPDDDDAVDEVSLAEFNAQLAAQSARDAKAAMEIGQQEFDEAFARDQAQGLHGDGDVELTMAENWTRSLTKTYRLTRDGKIEKDPNTIGTGFGRLARVVLSRDQPIASLAKVLRRCQHNQALMMGRLPGDAPMRRMTIKAKYEALLEAERDLAGSGPLYRGKLCIYYAPGKPALLIIDFDAKDLPDAQRELIEQAGGLRQVLASIDPQWGSVGFLERPSVSTGIKDKRNGQTTPGGGLHLYAIVDDGGDLERYIAALFDRLTLAEFGWIVLSAAGSYLRRSLIDKAASGVAFWLAFEAHAVLEQGSGAPHGDLEHVPGARKCIAREGPRLNTRALPDLTDDQHRQLEDIWAKLKLEKEPEARAIRLVRGAKDIARLKAAGVTQDEAERLILERHEMGRLSLDATYWFDEQLPSGKRSATGWELLQNGAEWFADGRTRTGADPEEADYGGGLNKTWWKINDHSQQAGLFATSRAHGGQKYILAYDAADVVALMDEKREKGGSTIVRLAELKEVYRRSYLAADPALADNILRKASLPLPIALEFGDPDEPQLGDLARERLIEVLRDPDRWDQLGRLRCLGRFRDEALAELRGEDEVIGLGFDVDWNGLMARMAVAQKTPPVASTDYGPLDHRPEVDALMRKMNPRFFLVNDGKATIFEQDTDEEGHPRYRYHSPPAFKSLHSNRLVAVATDEKGKDVKASAGVVWFGHPRRREYTGGEVFDPQGRHRPDQFNRWQGWGVQPIKGRWSLLRAHIREVIANGDLAVDEYVVKWCARLVQMPWEVGQVILVLRGLEGAGKGTLGWALMRLAGAHGYYISSAGNLTGTFNDHLFGRVFVFADEAVFAGDRAAVNKLKSIATEPQQAYNGKNRPLFQGRNAAHVMTATNNRWVIPADPGSRRWCVLDVSDSKIGDHAYFAAIRAELEGGGAEAMLYDLLHMDLAGFSVFDYPVTAALLDQRDISLDADLAWWKDCLSRGYVWTSECGQEAYFHQWHNEVTTEILYRSYEKYARSRQARRIHSRGAFGRFMVAIGAVASRPADAVVGERRTSYSGELVKASRPHGYVLGNLAVAQAAFTKQTSIPV